MKSMLLLTVGLMVFTSCQQQQGQNEIKNGEGFVEVTGGKIWYRVTGQGDKTPILMLHGGPGYPSQYLNPLKVLGKDRKIITFDQLGCGRSDKISDTTLMTVDNFVDQVNKLATALNVNDFYLYGHSWGTMLGVDYYLKYPQKVKALILASPCLVSDIWESDSDSLIAKLPDSLQVVLRNNIKGISQDSTTLANAVAVYWSQYYTRISPTSADFDSTASQVGWNVYQYMWGDNDFFASGTLKNYDRSKDLPSIKVPTLYIGGEFDPARPRTLKYYQSLTPNSEVAVVKNAGHVTMHDNAEDNIKAIAGFLETVEKK
jgi:proline iminopeptidase